MSTEAAIDRLAVWRRPAVARVAVWVLHLALPLAGLAWILLRPEFDWTWQHNLLHVIIVGAGSAAALWLGLRMRGAADRHDDARLRLLSLALVATAGFQVLHALATPAVLVDGRTAGFDAATPVGIVAAAMFAGASAVELTPARQDWVRANHGRLHALLLVAMVAWFVVSIAGLPPLDRPFTIEQTRGTLASLAVASVLLYGGAAWSYFRVHRRRPAVMLLGVVTAFALLAESMVVLAMSRTWQASWWEWHVLQVMAFGFLAYSAHAQYRREGSATGLFAAVALEESIERIQATYRDALDELVELLRSREVDEGERARVASLLGARFDLTERQTDVLGEAADALAAEQDQIERLGALVDVGRKMRVIVDEDTLITTTLQRVQDAYPDAALRVGRLEDGRLSFSPPSDAGGAAGAWHEQALANLEPVEDAEDDQTIVVHPLTVKREPAGVLEVVWRGRLADRDRSVLASLATQLSIALENARLYRQLDGLFRSYMSPDVATALIADPERAALGGRIAEVTVLMADLRGFTTFSEQAHPGEVVDLLNTYFGAIVPIVLDEGGTVVQFVGDAIMAVFNAPVEQPDHARRAVRAGLVLQERVAEIAADRPDAPLFRVGINTGPALVGNIGAEAMRNFTAIGDTTNTAARLEGLAETGQVVVSASTLAELGDGAQARSLGSLSVKGRQEPVEAFVLEHLGA